MLRCEAFNPLKFMLIIDFKQELKVREEKNHQMCEWRPAFRVQPTSPKGGKGGEKRQRTTRRLRPAPVPLFVHFVDLRVGRGTRTTLAEQIYDLRFRKFRVGDGGGYYLCPVQLILSFSCFRGRFREFRVMIFTPEESLTRNRNTPA
jgi:hypothetical protein